MSIASDIEGALGITYGNPSTQGSPTAYAQTYRNKQVPNMQQAIYRLSIHQPNKAKTALATYTFPLSPSSIRRTETSMATFYDTPGTAAQYGVSRLVDQYGMAPLIFDIEGTTGWQKHLTDGFKYTGLESIQTVQSMLLKFANLNVDKMDSQSPNLYTMEFYDYFSSVFYEVVPVGPQQIWQDKQRPVLSYYKFHLVGVKSIAHALEPANGTNDPIAAAFGAAVATVQNNVSTFISGVSSLYGSAQSVVSSVSSIL